MFDIYNSKRILTFTLLFLHDVYWVVCKEYDLRLGFGQPGNIK